GARWRHLWVMGLLAAPVLYAMIMKIGYRRQRMMAFLDPYRSGWDWGRGGKSCSSFHIRIPILYSP
ncbi:MAG TPA: hypothetical protein VIL61_02680, partial [Nitrospiria bacterium]